MKEKGQTLIFVLLVMVLALGIGLTISRRIISGYKRSTSLDSSSRALAVSEAALEKFLALPTLTLDTYIQNNNCGSNCTISITGNDGLVATATVALAYSGNSTNQVDVLVKKDQTYEANLSGYSSSAPLEICWNNSTSGNNPSIYASYVNGNAPYTLNKYAYNAASTIYSSNGFSNSSPDLTYPNCFTIPAKTSPRLLRIRAIYNDAQVRVIPKNGATIPIQGYLITSTGSINNVKKTVRAIRTKPFLPSSFDFAVFSTSLTEPLQN